MTVDIYKFQKKSPDNFRVSFKEYKPVDWLIN